MNDTTPQIAARMEDMFRKKSPSQRLSMGCSMFDLSKKLVKGSVLGKNPTASQAVLCKELFLKFYGTDFDSIKQQKILKHLSNRALLR